MAINYLNPFPDPFRQGAFGDGEVPRLQPQETEDLLANIGDGLIGGLGYLGGLLEKPSRAIRGVLDVLTGGPTSSIREAAAFLPFSDSLGITRHDDRVSGEKLLRNVGLISEPETRGFDESDAAGIAAEILLDPLSYLGVGTLTKGGKALEKGGGKVRVGYQNRALGADYAKSEIDRLIGTGNVTERDLVTKADNVIPAGVQGVNPRFSFDEVPVGAEGILNYTNPAAVFPKDAAEAIEAIRTGRGTPAPGRYTTLEGFDPADKTPLLKVLEATDQSAKERLVRLAKRETGNATPLGNTLTFGKLPLGLDRALGIEPFRIDSPFLNQLFDRAIGGIQASGLGTAFSRLFDSRVGNASTRQIQEVQRDVGAPAREAYRSNVLGESYDLRHKLLGGDAPLVTPLNEKEAMRFLYQAGELGDTFTVGTQVRYGAPRTLGEYESQLATRPSTAPQYPNRLEEMRASGELADMARPGVFDGLRDAAEDMNRFLTTLRQGEEQVGLKSADLLDEFAEYLPRYKNRLPRKEGEGAFAYAARALQDSLKTTHESQIGRKEFLKNIPGGKAQIDDWVGNVGLRQASQSQRIGFFLTELTGQPATQSQAVFNQAKALAEWVPTLGEYGVRAPLFSTDLISAVEKRGLLGASASGGADASLEAIRRFAQPAEDLVAAGTPGIKVSDILSGPGFGDNARELLRRDLRLNDAKELSGLALPADVAADLVRVQKAWTSPEEVRGILKLWDDGLQLFKGMVTYPFLAFHTRNALSGTYNMWRDGALSWQAMKDAKNILTADGKLDIGGRLFTREEFIRELVSNRVALLPHTKQFGDLAEKGESVLRGLPGKLSGEGLIENAANSVGKQWADKPKRWFGNEATDPDLFFVVRQGKAAGSFVEDWIRTSHYIAKRRQGFAPAEAAAAVRKYQYDYSSFTQAERNVFKRLIPWWSFSRNNLPPLLEELATNPARLNASIKAATSRPDGQFVPGYISEGPAIPVPGAPAGSDRYLASLGLPFEDELVRMLGNLSQGKLTRATQQGIGTLAPLLKLPLENAFGIQAHSGRRLEDLKATPAAELLSAATPLSQNAANQLIGTTPLARFGTVTGQVLDERKDPLAKGVNLLTGAWVTDVDANKVRSVEVRDRLEQLLRGNDSVMNWEKYYVKPENLPNLTPEQLQNYLLYRELETQAREAAAKRKAGVQ